MLRLLILFESVISAASGLLSFVWRLSPTFEAVVPTPIYSSGLLPSVSSAGAPALPLLLLPERTSWGTGCELRVPGLSVQEDFLCAGAGELLAQFWLVPSREGGADVVHLLPLGTDQRMLGQIVLNLIKSLVGNGIY